MRRLLLAFLLIANFAFAANVDVTQLHVPPGFKVEIFADPGHKPRFTAFSPGGTLLATSLEDGAVVAMADPQHTGHATRVVTMLEDLNAPHGIAFHNGKLFVAETDKLVRYDWDEANLKATNPLKYFDLPKGGGHMTRTIIFANGKMYVAAGSSCNVCADPPDRAAVLEYNEDGSGAHVFVSGSRNAVGLALSPVTNTVWGTENGRDWLGDDLPPDEINDFGTKGGDFGWPYCYGDRVPDLKFSSQATTRCPSTIPPKMKLQAHSAPLGLTFYTGTMFPTEYKNDLFVAFHGSWNRSVPTGYKVVRIRMDKQGNPIAQEDFLTGFVKPGETRKGVWIGRPVGVTVGPDGALYVSDDASGPIYRISYVGKK